MHQYSYVHLVLGILLLLPRRSKNVILRIILDVLYCIVLRLQAKNQYHISFSIDPRQQEEPAVINAETRLFTGQVKPHGSGQDDLAPTPKSLNTS